MTQASAPVPQSRKFWAMSSLEATLSPASWLLIYIGGTIPLLAIFQPSLKELGFLILVANVDLWLALQAEKWLFSSANPPVTPHAISRPLRCLETMPVTERVIWVENMIAFPARRARHCLLISCFKVIPEIIVIVFCWQHAAGTELPRFLFAFACSLFLSTYLYGLIFLETHALISDIFADIHRRFDWSAVFARVQAPTLSRHFRTHDYLALLSVSLLVLLTQWVVIGSSAGVHMTTVALKVSGIGAMGMVLMSWLWYSSRNIFMTGLLRIFSELANFDPEKSSRSLPIHSTPILAQFERAFNTLSSRLRSYQRELSHRVYLKTEESRYQALGEMAGLVVHDLSTPLHIIRFCLDQIEHARFDEGQDRYFQQLQRSSQRAVELVESLRAYIRNPRGQEVSVAYGEAQGHVMRLLEVQFYSRGFSKLKFEIDPALASLRLRLAKGDMIHVLINLYANSLENLLGNDTPHPKISVKLEENRGMQALLSFRDNGTGLSAEAFERLTALNPEPETIDRGCLGGLGLRLVRRLIERYHGSLCVVDLPPEEKGTLFHFWMPSVPNE